MIGRLLLLALLLPPAGAGAATFVLVHGAFVGGGYWDPVAEGLRARGHAVIAPDLTGHGARRVDDPAGVTLAQHVDDVVAAIRAAEEPVILVSHSQGGRPATGAWDAARDRIAAVIFVEAVAPHGSGPLALPEETRQRAALARSDPAAIGAGVLAPPARVLRRYGEAAVAPQSLRTLHAPVPLTRGPLPETPGAYVIGGRSEARIFRDYARAVAQARGWTIWEIESGHDVVHDAGEVLTRLLDELSADLPAGRRN